jgi:hypothetical protein
VVAPPRLGRWLLVLATLGSSQARSRSSVVMGIPRICGGGLQLPGGGPDLVVAASARGRCVPGRGGSRDPAASLASASAAGASAVGSCSPWCSAVVGGWWFVAGRYGELLAGHHREKSFLRPLPDPATAASAGVVFFLGSVVVVWCSSPLPAALAPEGNLRSAGSGDEGDLASSSFLEASSRSRLQPGDRWMTASSPPVDGGIFAAWFAEAAVFRGVNLCLATMMVSSGARVAARALVVGSSRRVRGAFLGHGRRKSCIFPLRSSPSSRSCRWFARVAICWHVGQVGRWCPSYGLGCIGFSPVFRQLTGQFSLLLNQ